MKKSLLILSSALLLNGPLTSAHETQEEQGWCEDGTVSLMAEMDISKSLLDIFKTKVERCEITIGNTRRCGQFDDDWDAAFNFSTEMCEDVSNKLLTNEELVPIFHKPAIFNNKDKHHEFYELKHGIIFSCARCIMNNEDKKGDKVKPRK